MLPYTPKFYANGTIFDSTGSTTQTYVDVAWEGTTLCYLRDTSGRVDVLDTVTEDTYTTYVSSGANTNSIIVVGGQPYGFRGHDVRLYDDLHVMYVENDQMLVQESFDHSSRVVLLS